MAEQIHILNGDALYERVNDFFPDQLLIMRECLIEGPTAGENLDEFYGNRAKYLENNYGISHSEYLPNTALEISKILDINPSSEVNLWFEDDLFCQSNLWFLLNQFIKSPIEYHLNLVRPKPRNRFSFASLSDSELMEVYLNKTRLTSLEKIGSLWDAYKSYNNEKLWAIAYALTEDYDFIYYAVVAHIDRNLHNNELGVPEIVLNDLLRSKRAFSFSDIYNTFSELLPIYGFGDLQVKKLIDHIKKKTDPRG